MVFVFKFSTEKGRGSEWGINEAVLVIITWSYVMGSYAILFSFYLFKIFYKNIFKNFMKYNPSVSDNNSGFLKQYLPPHEQY